MKTVRPTVLALGALLLLASAGLTACAPTGGEKAATVARQQIGLRYTSGGTTPASGFDCSGLTSYAWGQAGYTLPRRSVDQYRATTRITKADLRPGDLVFYSSAGRGGTINHVAIYVGNGKIVQARKPGVPLSEDSLATFWTNNLIGYGRVPASLQK